jgi:hypothetical protein
MELARKPWVMRLREILHLPSPVMGPRDLAPFERDAAIWAAERSGLLFVVDMAVTVLLHP